MCKMHYKAFWDKGISVDVVDMECDLTGYKLVIAPMLYRIRANIGEKIESFVKKGGTFVTTYWSGIVDENDLCHLGGFPGPLKNVLGIWSEEIDALYDDEINVVIPKEGNKIGLNKEYKAQLLCDLIHPETAEVLAEYSQDFYKGRPAVTVNAFGEGKGYYIAFRSDEQFLQDFYSSIIGDLHIQPNISAVLPEGVTAQLRSDGEKQYVFIMNFTIVKKVAFPKINVADIQAFKVLLEDNNLL